MRITLTLILTLIAGTAQAQDWALRDSDDIIAADALTDRLSGQILTFYDDGKSEYYPDGRYTYTYANDGGTAYGHWRVEADGRVCIDFVNGFARCDRYVRDGNRLVLLDADGARFPVRP